MRSGAAAVGESEAQLRHHHRRSDTIISSQPRFVRPRVCGSQYLSERVRHVLFERGAEDQNWTYRRVSNALKCSAISLSSRKLSPWAGCCGRFATDEDLFSLFWCDCVDENVYSGALVRCVR